MSKADKSTALTHISADVEGMLAPVDFLPSAIVAPFYLATGIYVLYTNIGKAAALVVPASLRKYCKQPSLRMRETNNTIVFIATTTLLTHFVPRTQKLWNSGIDARVSGSTSVLTQLRAIKIIGLAPSMGKHLQSLREAEVELSVRRRALMVMLWTCCRSQSRV